MDIIVGGSIKNLGVVNSTININSKSYYDVGFLSGCVEACNVANCWSKGNQVIIEGDNIPSRVYVRWYSRISDLWFMY